MIKLSDYLSYLNQEIVQARKKADEQAILIAQEYAKHEYLKYFRVPRFSMPSVKLEIPVKITELNERNVYNYRRDDKAFVSEVNEKIAIVNKEKGLKLKPISEEKVKEKAFQDVSNALEKKDMQFVKNIDQNLTKVDLKPTVDLFITKAKIGIQADKEDEKIALNTIIKEALANRFTIEKSKFSDIFIDPNTSGDLDKDKILVNLQVEMVDEGIRIHRFKNSDGQEMEEIIFE